MLDTNVLIDGIKDENSAPWRIIEKIFNNDARLFTSHKLRREYGRILQREIADPVYQERIRRLLDIATDVELGEIKNLVTDDPEDDKVIATALAAGADYLISEDKHLLELDFQTGVRVVRPKEYLNHNAKDSSWSDFARLIGLN